MSTANVFLRHLTFMADMSYSCCRIFKHINIVKFCDDLRARANGFYVQNLHLSDDLYDPIMKNTVQNQEGTISSQFRMRSCQLKKFENNRISDIYVTSFPATTQHYPKYSAEDTTLVLECESSECVIVATAKVHNFAQEFSVTGIYQNSLIIASVY